MTPVIALDLSLTAPGYFIRDRHGVTSAGVWHTPKTLDGSSRMVRLDWIRSKVEAEVLKLGPDVRAFIEGYAFSRPNQAHHIGELGGVIRFYLWGAGIPLTEVPPASLKKFCAGSGNANKNVMMLNVYKRWGFETDDDNAADAYALGRFACCVLGIDEPTTKEQREALASLGKERSKVRRKAAVA